MVKTLIKEGSDIDLFIIKEDIPYLGVDRMRELDEMIRYRYATDFIVFKPEEVTQRLSVGDPFIKNILKNGKVLYDAERNSQGGIDKANEDFGFASISIENTNYFPQICFYFQQATEKYLKAYILLKGLKFRPIHNLLELLEICKEKDAKIEEIEESCRYLNPFYIDTRYPVHWPTHYDKEIAIKAKNAAEKVKVLVNNFFNNMKQ